MASRRSRSPPRCAPASERAISDGQKAGAVNEVEGLLLRTATQNLPLDQLMRLVRGVVG